MPTGPRNVGTAPFDALATVKRLRLPRSPVTFGRRLRRAEQPRQQDIDPINYAAMLRYLADSHLDGGQVITSATPRGEPYNPAVSIDTGVLTKHPDVEKVLSLLTNELDDQTLQHFNSEVDVDGKTPEQGANDWPTKEGYVG